MKNENTAKDFDGRSVYERTTAVFFDSNPVEDLNETVHQEFMGYGTAAHEFLNEKKVLMDMAKTQSDQMRNSNIEVNRKIIFERALADSASYLIVEEFDFHDIDNGHHYSMRLSTILEKTDGRWLVSHMHGSTPDSNIAEEEALPMEGLRRKNRELEKKIKEGIREAELEAALERIRSSSLAMQKTEDLRDVVTVLFEQMQELSVDMGFASVSIFIFEEGTRDFTQWLPLPDGVTSLNVPYIDHPISSDLFDARESGTGYFEKVYSVEEKNSWVKKGFEATDYKKLPEEFKTSLLESPGYAMSISLAKHSGICIPSFEGKLPSSENVAILKRVGKVFEQTYTRFLDLKKAEEQAREAQIANALEKVRSRSLAMQNSDELIEVAQLLREEMGALGVEELETSSIFLHNNSNGKTECWFTTKDTDDPTKSVSDRMTIDLQDTWVGQQMDEFYVSGQDRTSILTKGDNRIEWFRYIEKNSDLLGNSNFFEGPLPERTIHLCKFSNGFLGAASPGDISDKSWDLMKRATSVFSFAYTRFRDLQQAEESARRARQQASLDRVRADISSMRSTDDFNRITPLVWNELTALGVPFIRCGIFIIHEAEKEVEVYLSKPDGTSLAVINLPFYSNELATKTVDAWRSKEVYTQHWSKQKFLDFGKELIEQKQISDLKMYQGAEEAPESLHLHFIPFTQGMLYVGSTQSLDDKEISLSESLAKAFSIAYARYDDFVKLEKAKSGIEDALSELKSTQSQLIQQEKLASLGQLTAGIAHEIKNPLNFVNNFSELSVELIEEAREEIRDMRREMKGDSERSGEPRSEKGESPLEGSAEAERRRGVLDSTREPDLILEILDDIEANLRKIHEHGSRADGIVKSMLQHSRGGDGKMEPSPLNPLIKEYVNLAFHGMRAGNDPINVDIDLQLDDDIGEVPLVAEDFSRVVLNLVNNAFDAMCEKTLQGFQTLGGLEDYHPKLTVQTHQSGKSITIEIEDNGSGIPDEIKDKILQPFFTTKKGTQGTGLGLSITNDIVKAHGGDMDIDSQPGKTVFKIKLNG